MYYTAYILSTLDTEHYAVSCDDLISGIVQTRRCSDDHNQTRVKRVTRVLLTNVADAQHRNVARVTPAPSEASITLGESRTEPLENTCDF